MFKPRPFLTERLKALGVFSGIAIGAVSGFELVITGGFDPITPSVVSEAPSEYDEETVMRAWHYQPYVPTAYVTEASQHLLEPIDDVVFERLAGGPSDRSGPEPAIVTAPDDEELRAEIERLYEETALMAQEIDREVRSAAEAESANPEGVETDDRQEGAPDAKLEPDDELHRVEVQPLPPWVTTYETASPS